MLAGNGTLQKSHSRLTYKLVGLLCRLGGWCMLGGFGCRCGLCGEEDPIATIITSALTWPAMLLRVALGLKLQFATGARGLAGAIGFSDGGCQLRARRSAVGWLRGAVA